jgi:copper chaperone
MRCLRTGHDLAQGPACAGRHTGTMIELTLPTMTCGHCVRTVTQTVQRVDPAATLVVDLPQHRVQIESALPAQVFSAALADEGYVAA